MIPNEDQHKYLVYLEMLTALSDYKNFHPTISFREGMFLNLFGKAAGHLLDVYKKFYCWRQQPVVAIKMVGFMVKVLDAPTKAQP